MDSVIGSRRRRHRYEFAVLGTATVVGLGLLAGCSSGPDFDTFPAATTIAIPTTTLPASTTAVPAPAETAAPDTTVPPETAAPTTEPPVATTTLEQSITEGFRAIRMTVAACAVTPATCDIRKYAVEGSPEYVRFNEVMNERITAGLLGLAIPGAIYDNIEAIALEPDQRAAIVTACTVDGGWLMQDAGTPDDRSDDVIVDDSVGSYRLELRLALTPDGWRATDSEITERWSGENRCGSEQ